MTGHARLAFTAGIFLLAATLAPAATRTWTGGTPGDPTCPPANPTWGDPCNWSGKALPAPGDDLVFNGGSSVNSFPDIRTYNSLTVNGHVMTGGAVILNAGLSASGAQISLSAITLNAHQIFTAPIAGQGAVITSNISTTGNVLTLNGAGTLHLAGIISGSGFVSKRGVGTALFTNQNTYTGSTGVDTGLLLINGSQPQSEIDIEGGMLGGSGIVGPVAVRISPATLLPGNANNGTGRFTVSGDLTFSTGGGTSLKIDLKGTAAGTSYDQVDVTGGLVKLGTANNLEVTLGSGFNPAPGDLFVIINTDGTDPIQGSFEGLPEGTTFTVGGTTFFISYKGGDGNDVVLHLSTTRTWDGGGGNDKWSTAANWVGDVVPAVGDDLVFPLGAAQLANTNDLPAGTVFNSITIQAGGYFLVGNAIGLRNGITSTATSGGTVAVGFASLRLELDQSFTNNGNRGFFIQTPIDTNGHRVTLAGSAPPQVLQSFSRAISGTGGFTMAAAGFCFLDGTSPKVNTYTGTTQINSGTLLVRTIQPSSPVQLTGGTLRGQGRVGPVTATGGSIKPHDGVPEALEVAGDLTLSSTAQYAPDISNNGNFSQLIVTGAVRLNSAALRVGDNHLNASIGESFAVISNDGSEAVEGTFASLPEGSSVPVTTSSGNRTYSISYTGGDGNDVVLTLTALPTPTPTPGLVGNVSTRLPVGTGDNVLIEGFIVLGPGGSIKKIMVRALGPFLSQFGVTDALANPTLEIRDASDALIATNNNWRNTELGGIITGDQSVEIEGSGLAPANDLESAIIANLSPGSYTAVVRGVGNTTGTGIVDAFDMSAASPARLANVATRGLIQPGDQLMIAGLITQQGNVRAVVRAIGPSLSAFGITNALPDTILQLRDVNGAIVKENDDWQSDPQQKAELEATGLQPGNGLEAALVATLPPGQYTAQVRGKPEATGIGVVEVYFLQ